MIEELEVRHLRIEGIGVLELLDHLPEFCAGLHAVDAVDIPQLMKELYKDLDGVPQFINAMEAAQRKSKRAKLVINNEYLHAVALKSLLQSEEYETETREWLKLPEADQTWGYWKTTVCAEYVTKRRSKSVREREQKPFGGSAQFEFATVRNEPEQKESNTPTISHQILDSLEGYLDNTCGGSDTDGGNGYTSSGIDG